MFLQVKSCFHVCFHGSSLRRAEKSVFFVNPVMVNASTVQVSFLLLWSEWYYMLWVNCILKIFPYIVKQVTTLQITGWAKPTSRDPSECASSVTVCAVTDDASNFVCHLCCDLVVLHPDPPMSLVALLSLIAATFGLVLVCFYPRRELSVTFVAFVAFLKRPTLYIYACFS